MGFGYGGEGIGLVGEFWGKEMDSQRHFQRSLGCLMSLRLRTRKKESGSSKANEMLLQISDLGLIPSVLGYTAQMLTLFVVLALLDYITSNPKIC